MAIVKVSELSGVALDWAVAKCNGVALVLAPFKGAKNFVILGQNMKPTSSAYTPSTSWGQGGPIIEREGISWHCGNKSSWHAYGYGSAENFSGSTPLITARRCYVASKLGETVEIPNELI